MSNNDPSPGESVLILDSDIAELQRLGEFLEGFCEQAGVSEEIGYHLQLALEELVVNAIQHGGCEPKQGAIRLAIKREDNLISAELSDCGVAFNPLDAPLPDLTKNLCDRPVGGLGIHLVRHLIPSIRYERRGSCNYLYLTKPMNPKSGPVSAEEEAYADGNGDNQG